MQADVNKAADDFDEILRRSRASLEVQSIYKSLHFSLVLAGAYFLDIWAQSLFLLTSLILQDDKADFELFERMVEKDRNRHLFFQDLYRREHEKKKARSKKKAKTEASRKPVPSFHTEPKQVCLRLGTIKPFPNKEIVLSPLLYCSAL